MNWGTGIAIAYISFALFLGYMVYLTTTVNPELVTEDYYAREIAFQEKIDQRSLAEEDGQEVVFAQSSEGVRLNFSSAIDQLNIELLRPSDQRLDRDFEHSESPQFTSYLIKESDLKRGLYALAVTWQVGQKKYYKKSPLYVN
ncbi:MAG: FixH family protein [Flavobacteriales bacterium]|nr:FixH family protein [Flavobacteriales bacterium]